MSIFNVPAEQGFEPGAQNSSELNEQGAHKMH